MRRDLSHFSISWLLTVIIKSQGWRLNSQVPPIWIKYSWIKYSHGHNFSSESIDKDWTFISANAIAVLRATSGGEYCNKTALEGGALAPKWPRLRPLTLTGVADRCLSSAIFSYFPWVSWHNYIDSSLQGIFIDMPINFVRVGFELCYEYFVAGLTEASEI